MTAARKTLILQIGGVALLMLLAKFGAFGKDVFLSLIYGASDQTDAYFIANAIPGLVFAGFLATIGLVFIPLYTRAGLKSDNDAQSVVQTGIALYFGISLCMTVLTLVFADQFVQLIAPNASAGVHDLAGLLTRIMCLGFVFSSWVGLNNALLQANKIFVWPAAAPIFNHGFVILGLFIAWIYTSDIILVVVFAVLGWIVQAPLTGWRAKGLYQLRPFNNVSKIYLKQFALLSIPVFFSVSLDQFNTLIDLYLSSQFGSGAISHLSYASRLMLLLAGLFSLMVSYFVFPYLSQSLAKADFATTKKQLNRAFLAMLFFTTPLALLCLVRSTDLVKFVFGRGDFGADDIAEAANVLKLYAIGMVFIGAREIFNRVFLADQRALSLFIFGVIAAAINIGASLYFMPTFGLAGIALGTSCGAISYMSLQTILLVSTRRQIISPLLLLTVTLAAISGAAMVWSLKTEIFRIDTMTGMTGTVLELITSGLFYVAVFTCLFAATIPVLGKRAW